MFLSTLLLQSFFVEACHVSFLCSHLTDVVFDAGSVVVQLLIFLWPNLPMSLTTMTAVRTVSASHEAYLNKLIG